MPDRADDIRDRAFGFRKGLGRCARWRHEVLGGAPHDKCGGEGKRNSNSRRAAKRGYELPPSDADCHWIMPAAMLGRYHAPTYRRCPHMAVPVVNSMQLAT